MCFVNSNFHNTAYIDRKIHDDLRAKSSESRHWLRWGWGCYGKRLAEFSRKKVSEWCPRRGFFYFQSVIFVFKSKTIKKAESERERWETQRTATYKTSTGTGFGTLDAHSNFLMKTVVMLIFWTGFISITPGFFVGHRRRGFVREKNQKHNCTYLFTMSTKRVNIVAGFSAIYNQDGD